MDLFTYDRSQNQKLAPLADRMRPRTLDELIGRWVKEREAGEGFGDFTVRAGIIRPVLDPARDFWE